MKIKTKWIIQERAERKRRMSDCRLTKDEQSRTYAEFILAREGIAYHDGTIQPIYQTLRVNGRNQVRARGFYVRLTDGNQVKIGFPNWDWTPSAQIAHEDELALMP